MWHNTFAWAITLSINYIHWIRSHNALIQLTQLRAFKAINIFLPISIIFTHGERRRSADLPRLAGCDNGVNVAVHAVSEENGGYLLVRDACYRRRRFAWLEVLRPPCISVVHPRHRRWRRLLSICTGDGEVILVLIAWFSVIEFSRILSCVMEKKNSVSVVLVESWSRGNHPLAFSTVVNLVN